MQGLPSLQTILESALFRAHAANSEDEAVEILEAIDHPELSAIHIARAARTIFPRLFAQLKVDKDTDLANLLPTIALTLFDKEPYEPNASDDDNDEEEEEEGQDEDEDESYSQSDDDDYQHKEHAEHIAEPPSRKRKELDDKIDEIRSEIRKLMPIFSHLDSDHKNILSVLLELNDENASVEQMRSHILALATLVPTLSDRHQVILSSIIKKVLQ
jgi:hypothetical protein